MEQISILGCGWLGLPLSKLLLNKGFLVNGSTTSQSKILDIENVGVQPFLILLNENEIQGNIASFLENSKILIIDIPPKLRGEKGENFVSKIKILVLFIENSTVENVIFVSSTSVYADENKIVTEETLPQPETNSGKQLLQVEEILLNNKNFKTTIIRFGGLIGKDRHPIRFLAGQKNLENPDSPVNLIHQTDCIGIILKIIENDYWNEIFNAVTPFHPTRKEYYTQKATDLKLEIPRFAEEKLVGKTISSDKLMRVLDYKFIEEFL